MTNPPDRVDVFEMLAYAGPTSRQQTPPAGGISTADLVSSDENEKAIERLLSSRTIPFVIERPELGWKGVERRMIVTVPQDRYPDASAIFAAAVEAGMLEKGQDDDGLNWY
jgi:hypothetical protein